MITSPEFRESVLEDLRKLKPDDFVAKHIFDRCPAIFRGRDDFVLWKRDLSANLDVDAAAITLVGSAAVGISLNPYKSFKNFDDTSDVDVAIISQHHFQLAWRYLRKNTVVRYRLKKAQQNAWDEHTTRLIYWGTIATDKLLPVMPFAREWIKAASLASQSILTADREVNFRIYTDYEALRSYQVNSVRRLRDAIDREVVVANA